MHWVGIAFMCMGWAGFLYSGYIEKMLKRRNPVIRLPLRIVLRLAFIAGLLLWNQGISFYRRAKPPCWVHGLGDNLQMAHHAEVVAFFLPLLWLFLPYSKIIGRTVSPSPVMLAIVIGLTAVFSTFAYTWLYDRWVLTCFCLR